MRWVRYAWNDFEFECDIGWENAGFFVDVRVFNASNAPAMIDKKSLTDGNAEETRGSGECGQDDSVDESQNLMLKLKFLPYKVMLKNQMRIVKAC